MIGDITLGEYPLYFMPLEPDLLSMELDSTFKELYLVRYKYSHCLGRDPATNTELYPA